MLGALAGLLGPILGGGGAAAGAGAAGGAAAGAGGAAGGMGGFGALLKRGASGMASGFGAQQVRKAGPDFATAYGAAGEAMDASADQEVDAAASDAESWAAQAERARRAKVGGVPAGGPLSNILPLPQ